MWGTVRGMYRYVRAWGRWRLSGSSPPHSTLLPVLSLVRLVTVYILCVPDDAVGSLPMASAAPLVACLLRVHAGYLRHLRLALWTVYIHTYYPYLL